jgi:hypothetical protein
MNYAPLLCIYSEQNLEDRAEDFDVGWPLESACNQFWLSGCKFLTVN